MEDKKVSIGAKITTGLDEKIRAEATRLRLDRSEYVRKALEEKLAGRDAALETLAAIELKVVALADAVAAIATWQRDIVATLSRGAKK